MTEVCPESDTESRVVAKVRQSIVAMYVVCATVTCTRTESQRNDQQATLVTHTAPPSTVSEAVTTQTAADLTSHEGDEAPTHVELARAMRELDYARARRLADLIAPASPRTASSTLTPPTTSTQPSLATRPTTSTVIPTSGVVEPMLNPSTLTLVRGVSALRSGDAADALAHFAQLGETFSALKTWLEGLRADGLAGLPTYKDHLTSITARPSYRRLLEVTERLLADRDLTQAERTLALAQVHSTGDAQTGELRWLRARLRLAAGRAASAHSDVRWLAVLHPEHPRSNAAMSAIARGDFPVFTAQELLTRAQTAA